LIAVTGYGAGESRGSMNLFQRVPFRLLFGATMTTRTSRSA
jgi:hypothetical protein